jgi:truncated hemoglobin YjbI
LDEKDLTEKQRKWLETSRSIRTWPLTKSEKQTLERLYADMLPQEQQELRRFIQEKYGAQKTEEQAEQQPDVQTEDSDPIETMMRRVWHEPSKALRTALSKAQVVKAPRALKP